ncbi:SusC/RagA family TonB-linked outer membrane protein [Pedobacter nyackensis]|uniref:SusC/RagA family TonB-linked outer membrane protein n=1 Tax=Pedobacter nyackensis TaxID=475255 RepID=UPI0029305386|nr:SusC/RagA family TonB-linked outer membrane protein [Pedobacter nyackensis]
MKQIYLRCLTVLLFSLITVTVYAQKKVTGTVRDPEGQPIPGASVFEKGKNNGTMADAAGRFTLTVPETATLTIKYIGFHPKEVSVAGSIVFNIQLVVDEKSLSEVVVTALGVKKEKRALGYSATTVKTSVLENDGSPMNSLSALYGQAPGLRISSTALGPSGGFNVNIRNAVALVEASNTRPLFVIDGIPMLDGPTDINRSTGNGLNDLNMNDIESFEIMRGAKASVLYGHEGANGVILITTKSGGKKDGLGIDFSYSRSFDKPWIMQEFQNEFGSGFPAPWSNPGTVDKEGFFIRNGQQAYYPTNYNFGPKMDGREILWYDGVKRPYVAQPNNIDAFYQNGFTNNVNVAIQGGGELGNIRASYTRNDFKGIFQGYDVSDNKFMFSGDFKVTNRLRFKLVSTYVNTFNHNSPNQNQDAFVTYGIPRQLDVKRLSKEQIVDPETGYFWWYVQNRQAQNPTGGIVRDGLARNYFWNQTMNSYDNTREHFINSATISINLGKGFSLETLGGFDLITNHGETKERVTRPLIEAASGYYSVTNSRSIRTNAQSLLHYEKNIAKDLTLNAFFGGILQTGNSERVTRFTRNGFITRDWFSLNNSKIDEFYSSTDRQYSRGSNRLVALVASAQFTYKDWLYVELQGRRDGSSILPPENNSYYYPGASASFIYSDAFKLPEWISYGKFRSSWADVGRPGPEYFANVIYGLGSYGGTITNSPVEDLPPTSLKPEKKREFEFGLENRFLNNRIGFEFNVYHATMYSQIMKLSVAQATGVNSLRINAGKITTTGFELSLYGTPIKTKDFSWNMLFNASQSKPIVKGLYRDVQEQILWGAQGATVTARLNQPYGQIIVNAYNTDPVSGKRIVGADGYYSNDPTKQDVLGTVIPTAVGGLTNTFNYKGISLDFNLDYSFGSKMVSQTNMYMVGNGSAKNTLEGRDEAHGGLPFYVRNDGRFVSLPSHSAPLPADSQYPFIMHNGVILDGVKADGSPNDVIITAEDKYSYYWRSFMDIQPDIVYKNNYIKLRNITVGYTLPNKITQRMKIQKLNVSLYVNNVAYLYKTMPNVDAEALNGTNAFYENNAWPAVRSFGASVRASF